jgi:hypothetical protein
MSWLTHAARPEVRLSRLNPPTFSIRSSAILLSERVLLRGEERRRLLFDPTITLPGYLPDFMPISIASFPCAFWRRTLGVSCGWKRERGTSGRCKPSAPRPCSASSHYAINENRHRLRLCYVSAVIFLLVQKCKTKSSLPRTFSAVAVSTFFFIGRHLLS